MKPNLIVRKGNKFVVDEDKILPYMRGHKDYIMLAVAAACSELKYNPDKFSNDPVVKLQQMNNIVYDLLEKWKVYKG